MILRRRFLANAAAFVVLPSCVRASSERVSFSASLEQGSLVIGKTEPGVRVTVDGANVLVSPQGQFAFGFAFDQKQPAAIALRYADGTRETRMVAPVPRQYEIQSITGIPEKFVTPPPEVEARIKREGHLVSVARTRNTDETYFADGLDWPVPGIISSVFGSQRILNGVRKAPHMGVDIAAPEGTPIHAPTGGIVSLAEPDFYLDGGITLLDHGHGVSTCYVHQSKLLVKAGDKVKRGDVIGLVGMTGRATGPHLHWGLNLFQLKLDPSRSTAAPAPAKA
jgi:murein DD-endopeptidase MepM/ murein hydrolase activator NlpD